MAMLTLRSDPEDKKIIRKLIEKALDILIRKSTGNNMMRGIFLVEDPILLYRCEKARLYHGSSLTVTIKDSDSNVDDSNVDDDADRGIAAKLISFTM